MRSPDTPQLPPGFRKMIEELVDLGILILDALDGEADLEDGGDGEDDGTAEEEPDSEPSLGATEALDHRHAWRLRPNLQWFEIDLELAHE